MKIPFMDLSASFDLVYPEIMEKLKQLINNTSFIGGKEIELFEEEFASYCRTNHAVACSNGTDAIILALKALGIGCGDTVLTIPHTFIATSEAITATGAKVDFIDIEEKYFTMSPEALENYLLKGSNKDKVKAIIPVHIYGQMANMPKLIEIANKYGIKVIEDSAQAHGAEISGKRPGAFGNLASFSFYPGKNLGAFGDAGAIATNDYELYKKIKMLVNHGRWKQKYEHSIEGYNKRMDTIQAAILRIKLKHLDKWNDLRTIKTKIYNKYLEKKDVIVPYIREDSKHVFHLYVIRVKERNKLLENLKSNNISSGIHYPIPLHLQEAYKYLGYTTGSFPISEKIAKEIVSLPLWPEITEEQIEYVCKFI